MSTNLRTIRYVGFALTVVLFLTFFGKIAQPISADEELNCPNQSFNIPWTDGQSWRFTGGPHYTTINSAKRPGLDFAPPDTEDDEQKKVRAVTNGWVYDHPYIHTSDGYLYQKQDGTDWHITYAHLDLSKPHAANGTYLHTGDVIGIAGNTHSGNDPMGIHLHIGFACGGYDESNHISRLEGPRIITLEGWRPSNYHENEEIILPNTHLYDTGYNGYLRLGNEIKHACDGTCPPPYNFADPVAEKEVRSLKAGCGVVYAGYRPDGPFSDIIRTVFDAFGKEASLGCSQNPVHTAGEVINGVNYNLVLQDFLKDGVWNVIIHDELDNAPQAFVILDDFREAYFATDHWYVKLGAPLNNESDAATSPQGTTGTWQQFESGQIYGSAYGTHVTYGRVYDFYYHYNEGGTHSDLGFPTCSLRTIDNSQQQNFEGGAVYCPDTGSCRKVDHKICIRSGGGGGGSVGSLYRKVNGLALMQFDPCDVDTTPPVLGATQLPATAVNAFVPRIEVTDASGIRWVHMHIRPQGGNFEAIPMTESNGMWEVSFDTNAYANGQVLEYLFWASDMTGNALQISGLNSVVVDNDHEAPTLTEMNVPATVDQALLVSVTVADQHEITSVTLHLRQQGSGDFTQIPLEATGTNWAKSIDTRGYTDGQVLEYLFWASDNAGNSAQLTGLGQVLVDHDTELPVAAYVNPPPTMGGEFTIRASITDASGVNWAKAYVTVNGATTERAMTYNASNQLWEVNYNPTGLPLSTVISYVIHAQDGVGNTGQVTGVQTSSVEDHQLPTGHFVNVVDRPYDQLVVQFQFDPDLSGIASATLYYNINGVSQPQQSMQNMGNNLWQSVINTTTREHGDRIQYLIHARDGANNYGQITGLMTAYVACPGIDIGTWCAKYYNNASLVAPTFTIQPAGQGTLNFNYGMYYPYAGMQVDNFSIKWSRRINFTSGTYTFTSISNEGIRLKINGTTLIDDWTMGGTRTRQATIALSGEHVVTVEYFEGGGSASISFYW